MGSFQHYQKQRRKPPGKIDSPLSEKLNSVKWGEFRLGDLFEIRSSKQIFHANELSEIFDNQVDNSFPYVVRSTLENGIRGYIIQDEEFANPENTLSFAQDTFSVFYQKQKYFTGNKVKILIPKFSNKNESIMQFMTSCFQKALQTFSWGTGSTVESIFETKIQLPLKENPSGFSNPCDTSDISKIDFDFMESFISELEEERISELNAYLIAADLKDYTLTSEEENALKEFENAEWGEYNLQNLFGKSSRGKRLKGEDRTKGNLPFVTAGEADTGISDFISNDVEIFSKNTTTIDMFGSAKYRNYDYGADDHVAVVHTEDLPKHSAIFVTSAIHKSSHTGKFDYSNNFYASDADELNIQLPTKNGELDYDSMQIFIKAVEKLVIKDVVLYADKKIEVTKKVVKPTEYKINENAGLMNVAQRF